jgi:hypothetical protein
MIRDAKSVFLFVEFHKKVLERKMLTSSAIIEQINRIRPFKWVDSHDIGLSIDADRSVFEQTGQPLQCDLIAFSAG